jgi:hypothetical protein
MILADSHKLVVRLYVAEVTVKHHTEPSMYASGHASMFIPCDWKVVASTDNSPEPLTRFLPIRLSSSLMNYLDRRKPGWFI